MRAGRYTHPMLLRILCLLLPVALLLHIDTALATSAGPMAGFTRVELATSAGKIIVAVDIRNAPRTSANFLTYVDDGRFDGTTFYRAARRKADPKRGYIQGGIRTNLRRALPPIPLETTSMTGLRHGDATLSMARQDRTDSATGNFFLTVGPTPYMDASGNYQGYAAFGKVIAGMDVVKRILASPSGGGEGPMKGQMILKPITILHARRLDGQPRPSGRPKAWLLWEK